MTVGELGLEIAGFCATLLPTEDGKVGILTREHNQNPHLSRTYPVRASAWLFLFWEKTWPLLVPFFMVTCVYLTFSWGGGWQFLNAHLPNFVTWLFRAAFAIAAFLSLWPLGKFELPTRSEVTRRIETGSRLLHRPLSAREDALAFGDNDGFSAALWREHQSRMNARLENLTSGTPAPQASRFDPFAIRAMLPIAAFAAFFFSFSPFGGSIVDVSGISKTGNKPETRMDAWINPPPYTRKPPVYLTMNDGDARPSGVQVPVGSNFVLRFVGDTDVHLAVNDGQHDKDINPDKLDEALGEAEFNLTLQEDSVLRLVHKGREIAQWGISLTGDTAPEITFFEEPRAALSGSLELTYTVKDDYGVVSAEADIRSLEQVAEGAVPLIEPPELRLPLPRQRARSGVSKINRDLTKHPWAGSRVALTLVARDDLEQEGRSETREIQLPGRRFSKPLAQALIEQRRILALDARQQFRVANLLDAVSSGPPEYIDNTNAFLGMRIAYRRIVDAKNHDDLRSSLDLLWEIALGVEFGDLSEAERRLREAQERLSEALENGASDEEIDELIKELRQAMNEMLQALSEQARNNPQQQNPFNPDQLQQLTQNDLENMMKQIENLAKSGSKDAARQLLSEMQRMMDNLRAGQHQQQRQAEGNEMNRALDKLSEMMQEQQRLMNETYRMQRQQQQQGRNNPNGQQDLQNRDQQDQAMRPQRDPNGQQQGEMTQEQLAEALSKLREQQEALRQQLGELGEQMEGLGLEPSEELNNAQNEMGQAGENLGKGQTGEAATDQAQALEQLRQGAQNMMQQMAGDRQQGGEQQAQQGGQGGVRDGQRSNDPLGRNREGQASDSRSNVQVPNEIDAQRARRVLDAIRERLSIPEHPLIEKNYLERLLRKE